VRGRIHLVDEDADKDLPHWKRRITSDRIGFERSNPHEDTLPERKPSESAVPPDRSHTRSSLNPPSARSEHAPETQLHKQVPRRICKARLWGKVKARLSKQAIATDNRLHKFTQQHCRSSILGFSRHGGRSARILGALTSGSSTSSRMVPKSLFTSFPLSENHLLNRLCAFTSTSYRHRQQFRRHQRYESEQELLLCEKRSIFRFPARKVEPPFTVISFPRLCSDYFFYASAQFKKSL
jgi:hypothetical protein